MGEESTTKRLDGELLGRKKLRGLLGRMTGGLIDTGNSQNHARSKHFYAESIRNPKAFASYGTDKLENAFQTDESFAKINPLTYTGKKMVMGEHASTKKGDYKYRYYWCETLRGQNNVYSKNDTGYGAPIGKDPITQKQWKI